MTTDSILNPYEKNKNKSTSKNNYVGNCERQNTCIFLLLILTYLKHYIKQYAYNYISIPLIHKQVIYLTITTQSKEMGTKLYWCNGMVPDGNQNLQEETRQLGRVNKKLI